MKFTVMNPTGSHCRIGHQNHPGIEVQSDAKVTGPQVFDVPADLVGYFTRALAAVLPGAQVLVGDEQPEQAPADADAEAAAKAEAEAAAKAEAEAAAKAEATAKKKADAAAKKLAAASQQKE